VAILGLFPAGNDQTFRDDAANRHAWIERGPGILKHGLHVGAKSRERFAL
jgi:hypothetical protein